MFSFCDCCVYIIHTSLREVSDSVIDGQDNHLVLNGTYNPTVLDVLLPSSVVLNTRNNTEAALLTSSLLYLLVSFLCPPSQRDMFIFTPLSCSLSSGQCRSTTPGWC